MFALKGSCTGMKVLIQAGQTTVSNGLLRVGQTFSYLLLNLPIANQFAKI